jgi:hypothetical protein
VYLFFLVNYKKLGLSQFLKLAKRRGCMAKTSENKAFLLAICRAPVATKTQDEENVRKAYKSLQHGLTWQKMLGLSECDKSFQQRKWA